MKNDIKKALSGAKGIGLIVIAVAAGVILLLLPSGKSGGNEVSAAGSETYVMQLETRTENMISGMRGVKECDVMITLDSSYAYLYASDQFLTQTSTARESEKKVVLRTVGGDEYPIVISETLPKVLGIAVVCRGGLGLEDDIRFMLSTLFALDESGIFVTCTE